MRGMYNIHDHDQEQMGFVPHTGSAKNKPKQVTTKPTVSLPTTNSFDISYYTIAFAIALITASITVLVCIITSSKRLMMTSLTRKTKDSSEESGDIGRSGESDSTLTLIILK